MSVLLVKERAGKYGTKALLDSELLACAAGLDVVVAKELLDKVGGLKGLRNARAAQLQQLSGVGPAKVLQIQAVAELAIRLMAAGIPSQPVVKSPEDVFYFMVPKLKGLEEEHMYVLLLNTKNRVLSVELVSKGTLNCSVTHPRETFKAAVRNCAKSIIVVHNHPSGDPNPSQDDIQITRRLAEAGRLLGIELLDHVIVGSTYISLKQEGIF